MILGLEPVQKLVGLKYETETGTWHEVLTSAQIGLLAVFVRPDSSTLYLVLLVCTTIGISSFFWIMFVYVLQIDAVRARLHSAAKWIGRLLGAALIVLGVRLWLSEAPELP